MVYNWTFSFVCVGFHVVANLALQLFLAGKTGQGSFAVFSPCSDKE